MVSLASTLEAAQSQLSVTQRSLTSTEDSLKLRMMELEGANAQLQVRCEIVLENVCRGLGTERGSSCVLGCMHGRLAGAVAASMRLRPWQLRTMTSAGIVVAAVTEGILSMFHWAAGICQPFVLLGL